MHWKMLVASAGLAVWMGVGATGGQSAPEPPPTMPVPPIPMPADRAEDSYQIYSLLMPGREFEGDKAAKWVIADTTISAVNLGTMAPDVAFIKVPVGSEADFHDLLSDFFVHRQETIHLTPDGFKLPTPFVLLNQEQTRLYGSNIIGLMVLGETMSKAEQDMRQLVSGAVGLNKFSEVYFNSRHTMAMVYTVQECGPTCGAGYWVVLGRKDGRWKDLHWMSPGWVS